MKTTVATRVLGVSEVSALRGMLTVFGTAFQDTETYCKAQPDDDYLGRLLSNEGFVAVAAYEGDNIIGGLAGYILPKFEQARSEFYIYDLAVDEGHRRKGVATSMIQCLKTYVDSRGFFVIFGQADYGDEAAIALYTKLGIREDVMHFDIDPRSAA